MLKDRFFYPLAIALIAAIIWFALSFATESEVTLSDLCENGHVTQGEGLSRLVASPGTSYKFNAATANRPAFATLTSHLSHKNAPSGTGVFTPVGADFADLLGGKKLRMTIRAKKSQFSPLGSYMAGYYTIGAGSYRWQPVELTDTYENFSFEFQPKKLNEKSDTNYFAIWPGVEGKQQHMDVEMMSIEVISGCNA